MNSFTGHLDKMKTKPGDPVDYNLPLDTLQLHLNPLLGRPLKLTFSGIIRCVACGRKIRKTYSDGHCFPCTRTLASCDFCILKPETCHYDQGTCRQPDWGRTHCMTTHCVYLANSSGLKVGITRYANIPTRWIDQGATAALPIMTVQTRLQSGLMEVMCKQHVSDRTNWRKMLQAEAEPIDLPEHRDVLLHLCEEQIATFRDCWGEDVVILTNEKVISLNFPVLEYPEKVTSLSFDKTPVIEGVLMGIKGQYLVLSSGVLNIRRHTGYEVTVTLS